MAHTENNSPVRIAIFASGRGSNFRALHGALSKKKNAPAEIVLCISNNPKPGAFAYSEEQGIPYMRLSDKMFDEMHRYEQTLMETLREYGVDMIILAGYMKRIPKLVVDGFRGRILNVHPALLPEFGGKGMYGMNVHKKVLESGKKQSGVTVHLADEEYDTGMIIAQDHVPIFEDDTPERLARRILQLEHRLFPFVVMEAAKRIMKGENIERVEVPAEESREE